MFAAEIQIELLCVSFAPPIHQNRQPPKKLHQTLERFSNFLELQTPKLYAVSKGCLFKSQKISCRRKPLKIWGETKIKKSHDNPKTSKIDF